jgi:predicted GIY-YIG superfamily endonuclease
MRTYYVYMLRCIDGTFYTGMTSDIQRRFAEHCAGEKPGYTSSRPRLAVAQAPVIQRASLPLHLDCGSLREPPLGMT